MRRDEHFDTSCLRRLQQLLDVFDGPVLFDALADEFPGHALRAQEVVLRIGEDEGGVAASDLHG